MATVKQYTMNLWRVHRTVSRKLGLSVDWGSLDERAGVVSTDIMLAGLIKALTDNGVVTDAQLNAVYNAIASAEFPKLPAMIPNTVDGEALAEPDLGG